MLISAFFPRHQGLVLFSIYLIGILLAVGSSLLFKRLFFKQTEAPFVMELPPYRVPTGRSVIRHMWHKGSQYLRKMGTIILVASVLIWALGHYPKGDASLTPAQQQEQSYIGHIGKVIEPVIRPLGFDWQIGISLISGLAAKEIVVSSMAVLTDSGDDNASLVSNLQNLTYTEGKTRRRKSLYSAGRLYNDGFHSALLSLYRDHYRHTSGSRPKMGVIYPLLYDRGRLDHLVYHLPDRQSFLNR